jgi:hypothetical protein
VAVGTNGLPIDTDADGLPDYADPDSDGDGLPDSWEIGYFWDLSRTPTDDSDGDCLTNQQEYEADSNPADPPVITNSLEYNIIPIGSNATFSVTTVQGCLNYQWVRDYTQLTSATNSSISLTNAQLADSGYYKLYAIGAGLATAEARLVVLDAPAWAVWTNFIANTNGKTTEVWATNAHPVGWPTDAPLLAWNTNCLLYGKTGFTAISPCNEFENYIGQIPVTALTKRHGYMRGHGQGVCGLRTNHYAGKKVWFCTADNAVVEMTVAADFIESPFEGCVYDYGLVVFTEDLPSSITPLSVMAQPSSIGVCFSTCQHRKMSANIPPFAFNDASKPPLNEEDTHQDGDSGSPDMIPMTDGSLVFFKGRSTSGPSTQMQTDMDVLSSYLNLNTNNYQLNWYIP